MKLTIIGGGPGGYTAAFEAARRGFTVTMIEQAKIGGTCLNEGCIPTKTLRASVDALSLARNVGLYGVQGCSDVYPDLAVVHQRKDKVISILQDGLMRTCKNLKVRYIQGEATPISAKATLVKNAKGTQELQSDFVLLATGSKALALPGLEPDHTHICSSEDALRLDRIPKRLLILGGGVIGCEMASIYSGLGSQVAIIEGQNQLLPIPGVDQEIINLLAREYRKQKIHVVTGMTLKDVWIKGDICGGTLAPSPFVLGGSARTEAIEADMILVTVGRSTALPRKTLSDIGIETDNKGWIKVNAHLETSHEGIYAVGDALGPACKMLAHVAAAEGLAAVANMNGEKRKVEYESIPSAIFTDPEIGMVGMSEAQAMKTGRRIVTGITQMRSLGKAHAMGMLPGFFKLIADAESGKILGIHIAGAHASDLIAAGAIIIANNLTLKDVATTVFPHPTLGEGIGQAAAAALFKIKAAAV